MSRKHLDGSEQILVTNPKVLDELKLFQGFRPLDGTELTEAVRVLLAEAKFVPRTEELEYDTIGLNALQIIPYLLLVDRTHPPYVFCYRRPETAGDERLQGKLSVGIGGHCRPFTGEFLGIKATGYEQTRWAILQTIWREAAEEVGLTPQGLVAVGLLYDGRNDVGQRHIGIVCCERINPLEITMNPSEVTSGRWCAPAQLQDMWASGEEFESWTEVVIPHLDSIVAECVEALP